MGDVIGDLNSRRGLIGEFIDKPANMKLVKASVPLSEMFQYVSTLRGMTKGALLRLPSALTVQQCRSRGE